VLAAPVRALAVAGRELLVAQDTGSSRHAPSCLRSYTTVTDAPTRGFTAEIHATAGDDSPCVAALVVRGGHVYVGGEFSRIDGIARPGLARLSTSTGEVEPNWRPAGRNVSPHEVFPEDRLAVGAGLVVAPAPNGALIAFTTSTGELDRHWVWPPPRGFNCCASPLTTVGTRLLLAADSPETLTALRLPSERPTRYGGPGIEDPAIVASDSAHKILVGFQTQ
jgi:hypothetical protein